MNFHPPPEDQHDESSRPHATTTPYSKTSPRLTTGGHKMKSRGTL